MKENALRFHGTLKKVRIVSNKICFYYCRPDPNDEVEQHLTINNNGRVWFSGYKFENHEKTRTRNFKIEKADADRLLGKIAAFFSVEYNEYLLTDIGTWEMELTNTDGVTYKFRGSVCCFFDCEETDLSDLVRDILGMDDLFVFDGGKPDVINKITVDYLRSTKINSAKEPKSTERDLLTWNYREHLIIDRETETIEYIRNIGTDCKISYKYEIGDGIESLLDNFDAEDLFTYIIGNPEDVIEKPDESKDYIITVEYEKNPNRTITGSFDKYGLPDDYNEFAKTVYDFICFYGTAEIFSPSFYDMAKRRSSDHIYCSVTFEEDGESYYYLTDDDSIEIGDFVIVPAGRNNHETVVKVVNIEYFNDENVPLPLDKTKHIIRKCLDKEPDEYNSYE